MALKSGQNQCFLPIWGFTKGILKKTSETRKKSKINTRTQKRKLPRKVHNNPSSPTHEVSNCKIRTLFGITWKKKSKWENGVFYSLVLLVFAVIPLYSYQGTSGFSHLIFFFHVMPNNVLILQFDTSWVGEDGLLLHFSR